VNDKNENKQWTSVPFHQLTPNLRNNNCRSAHRPAEATVLLTHATVPDEPSVIPLVFCEPNNRGQTSRARVSYLPAPLRLPARLCLHPNTADSRRRLLAARTRAGRTWQCCGRGPLP